MTLEEYQHKAMRTAPDFTTQREAAICAALGLTGEAGEFADMVKKAMFHGHDLDEDKMVKELGDILWYVTLAAKALGVSLELVASENVAKLERRYPAGFSEEASRNRKE
jgi:NTP pyrophosphatase (non-canonical NTP hydrolase)